MQSILGLMSALMLIGSQTTDPTARANLNPPPTPLSEVTVEGTQGQGEREDIARRRNPNEVVCETRPVTGSRFNQRRCRTRQQAAVAETEARRLLGDLTRGSGSTDAALSSGPATGPQ